MVTKKAPAVRARTAAERPKAAHSVRVAGDVLKRVMEVAAELQMARSTDVVDYLLRYALARREALARYASKKAEQ
jgi:hypothetical protein